MTGSGENGRLQDRWTDLVFISYAHEDVAEARALEELLRANGRQVWRDERRLKPGEHVDISIPAALRDAAAVVTIWSEHSVSSAWVRHETSYAVVDGKSATLVINPFDLNTLESVYRSLHCGDLRSTLADPSLLLARLNDLADPVRRRRERRFDVARLPTTFASLLFGREAETAALFAAWDSSGADKTNIVALDAMGGTGKTALVSHFIDELRRQGWRGANAVYAWSFYSQGTDERRRGSAEQFLETALTWFGHDGSPLPTQHDKGVRLAELVAGQRTVLVLDGLEPLQYAAGRTGGGQGLRGIAGALKEPGLAALFKQLAVDNPGLLIVTTRLRIPDLGGFPAPGVVSRPLARIATRPGIELLESLGVRGSQADLAAAVEDFRGHALALTNLGRYLATQVEGDVLRRDAIPALVDIGGQDERDPFRVMQAYETLFRRQIDEQKQHGQQPAETAAAKQLAILFLVGLFDRPVEAAAVDAVLAPPAIPGLTDGLAGLSRAQWDQAVAALRNLGLLAPKHGQVPDELDAHPLVREYFGTRLSRDFEAAWREAHTRLWQHYRAEPPTADARTIDDLTTVERAITHAALAGLPNEAVWLYDHLVKGKIIPNGFYAFDISILLHFFVEPWKHANAEIPETKQAGLFAQAASSLRSSGRLAEAAEAIEHNCQMLKRRKQWRVYVEQRVELVQILIQVGRLRQAIAEAAAALIAAEEHKVSSQNADLECFLGHAYHLSGNLKEAEKAFKRSTIAAKARAAAPRLSSFRQFALNEFYLDQNSRTVVRTWTNKTMEAARLQARRSGVRAHALDALSLGRLSLLDAADQADPVARQRQLEVAREHIDSCVIDLRANNQLDELPRALVLRAIHRRETGQFDQARKDLGEALHIARHYGMPLFFVDASLEAVRLERASGVQVENTPAAEHLTLAEKLIVETGYQRRRADLDDLKPRAR